MNGQYQANADKIHSRFNLHPLLAQVLGAGWIEKELNRPFEKWSLITRWLNSYDKLPQSELRGQDCLQGLENVLGILEALPDRERKVIHRKVKAHCPRTQFSSVLAEIGLYSSLIQTGCALRFEQKLIPGSNLDVDVSVQIPSGEQFHIEVYQLHPPDLYERQAKIGAIYGIACSRTDFDAERERIKNNIRGKITKFVPNQVTFVAIEVSFFSEMIKLMDEAVTGSEAVIWEPPNPPEVVHLSDGLWSEAQMHLLLNGLITYRRDPKTGLARDKSVRILRGQTVISEHIQNFLKIWSDQMTCIDADKLS